MPLTMSTPMTRNSGTGSLPRNSRRPVTGYPGGGVAAVFAAADPLRHRRLSQAAQEEAGSTGL